MPLASRLLDLASLARAAGAEVSGDPATVVTDVVLDTSDVTRGALFCCVPGSRRDGHDLAGQARAAGAAALVVERPVGAGLPELKVASVRAALAPLADAFYGHPSGRLDLIGVTGTNGKTTTTYMLEAIARAAGRRTGVIGTVEVRIDDERRALARTTPEAPDLQRLLAEMADSGVEVAVMEVSSHGLALGRVDRTTFRAAIFTNLTQDHLDFHASMEDYFEAKAALFEPGRSGAAIVNIDDPYGQRLADSARIPVVTTGTAEDADWRAESSETSLEGSTFKVVTPGGSAVARLRLAGHFNVANALGALAAASVAGIGLETAVAGLGSLAGVPGRFERVDAGQPFTVLVDYAHTPDSLSNSLRAARAASAGRVIAVIGCGGDRDRAKRPLMGAIAGRVADFTVVTSDNPRSEDPMAIIAEVAAGVASAAPAEAFTSEVDRRAAIGLALGMAGPGDVVVIAGKGHEQGQEFAGGGKLSFDDRVVAREELERLLDAGARR